MQLFESNDKNSHFLAALVIYQNIKERVNELIDSKEKFVQLREIIFNNLFLKLKNSESKVIDRICYSISILMIVGIITYWPECINDIIQLAKDSTENCYFSIIILQNIPKELWELNISQKNLLRIKDSLLEKKFVMQEFVFLIFTNVNFNDQNKINVEIFNQTLLLTKEWIRLGLNVLKIPILSQTLINYINSDNIKFISEIFSDSITFSNNSKFSSTNEEYDLEVIYEKCDKEELKSIENLIYMIKDLLIKINQDEEENFEILNGISNIFSEISENFIHLFFTVYIIYNIENTTIRINDRDVVLFHRS